MVAIKVNGKYEMITDNTEMAVKISSIEYPDQFPFEPNYIIEYEEVPDSDLSIDNKVYALILCSGYSSPEIYAKISDTASNIEDLMNSEKVKDTKFALEWNKNFDPSNKQLYYCIRSIKYKCC